MVNGLKLIVMINFVIVEIRLTPQTLIVWNMIYVLIVSKIWKLKIKS